MAAVSLVDDPDVRPPAFTTVGTPGRSRCSGLAWRLRFDSIEHARAHCREFFAWYNHAHRHSGIGPMTPATVHHGRAEAVHAARQGVLQAAYAATPERFVRRPPTPPALPTAAWINKPDMREVAAH